MQIPENEIREHPGSYGDQHGRVFWWGDQLYRAIAPAATGFYRDLFDRGIIQRLVEQELLVDTDVAPVRTSRSPLVLRHRVLPFVSYAYEWSAAMLQAAALKVLDLQLALLREGLTLQDAHPWNVLFDRGRPLNVDLGSITRLDGAQDWMARDEFCRFFRNPLLLMAAGHGRIARSLLLTSPRGVENDEVEAFTERGDRSSRRKRATALVRSLMRSRSARSFLGMWRESRSRATASAGTCNSIVQSVDRIRMGTAEIPLPSHANGGGWRTPRGPGSDQTQRNRSTMAILDRTRPTTVADLRANDGWFSRLAASHGSHVVALDANEVAVTRIYHDVGTHSIDILPVLMDVWNPSPGFGITQANQRHASGQNRFRCELAAAFTLVHDLAMAHHLGFSHIVGALSPFAERWLILEFVSPMDPLLSAWYASRRAEWYSLENLEKVLRAEFETIERFPSDGPERTLLLCRR